MARNILNAGDPLEADMPADRRLWKAQFQELPSWPCPSCGTGLLLKNSGNFLEQETGPSLLAKDHDAWEPDWIKKRFTGLLKCNNPKCGDLCAISGRIKVQFDLGYDEQGHPDESFTDVYVPQSLTPSPRIFESPEDCPIDVSKTLDEAFCLFWLDYESSANKFRVATEKLLSYQKIPSFSPPQKGKTRRALSLHSRIELFRKKNPDAGECLMAVKWLGNHGSHSGNALTPDDVLSASDLIEHALRLLYEKSNSPLQVAKKINKKKGPASAGQ
jgi:hypothetical protein